MLQAEQDTSPLTRSLLLCSSPGTPVVGVALFLILVSSPRHFSVALAPSAMALGIAIGWWSTGKTWAHCSQSGSQVMLTSLGAVLKLHPLLLVPFWTGSSSGVNAATLCFCSWASLAQVLQCKPACRVWMLSRSDLFGMTEELRWYHTVNCVQRGMYF